MSSLNNILNQKADQCVKCGLCLPHCPTYRLFENENESPRGRIALIQGLINQQIPGSKHLQRHLEHCLSCRACEKVCPSGVDYAYLLDHARQHLQQDKSDRGFKQSLLTTGLKLTTHKHWRKRLQNLLHLYQASGTQGLLRITGLSRLLRIHQLENNLPRVPFYKTLKLSKSRYQTRGKLGIFTGCTGNLFDQQTLQDTIYLLQRLGYEVLLPEQQNCCGALHQHQGQLRDALGLARQNITAFTDIDTIIYIASGCGAQLKDYADLEWAEQEQVTSASDFTGKIVEIGDFLRQEDLSQFQYRATDRTVTIHTPCSMRNALRQEDSSGHLLQNIPGINIHYLPADIGCCGAAGSYMLNHAQLARRIRQPSVDVIHQQQAHIVSTTNIGCRLHLQAGLTRQVKVTHPVSLLVQHIIHR